MDPTAPSTTAGDDLRAARKRLGLSRADLANLADCSYSSLSVIEQGAPVRRSRVLAAAWAALARVEADAASDQVAA